MPGFLGAACHTGKSRASRVLLQESTCILLVPPEEVKFFAEENFSACGLPE
jgi:hypothetical protein